jgi:hypothetical protein
MWIWLQIHQIGGAPRGCSTKSIFCGVEKNYTPYHLLVGKNSSFFFFRVFPVASSSHLLCCPRRQHRAGPIPAVLPQPGRARPIPAVLPQPGRARSIPTAPPQPDRVAPCRTHHAGPSPAGRALAAPPLCRARRLCAPRQPSLCPARRPGLRVGRELRARRGREPRARQERPRGPCPHWRGPCLLSVECHEEGDGTVGRRKKMTNMWGPGGSERDEGGAVPNTYPRGGVDLR